MKKFLIKYTLSKLIAWLEKLVGQSSNTIDDVIVNELKKLADKIIAGL